MRVRATTASRLTNTFGLAGEPSHNAYFVDLFVRVSNKVAFDMYSKFGYTVYRRVIGYYSGSDSEDAFGARSADQATRAHRRSVTDDERWADTWHARRAWPRGGGRVWR